MQAGFEPRASLRMTLNFRFFRLVLLGVEITGLHLLPPFLFTLSKTGTGTYCSCVVGRVRHFGTRLLALQPLVFLSYGATQLSLVSATVCAPSPPPLLVWLVSEATMPCFFQCQHALSQAPS